MKVRPLLRALPKRLKDAVLEPRNRTTALLATMAAAVAQVAVWVLQLPPWVETAYTGFQLAILLPLAVFLGAAVSPKRGTAIETLMRQPEAANAPFLLAAAAHLYSHCTDKRASRAALRELSKELGDLRTEQRYLPEIAKAVQSHCVWAVCGRKTDDAADSFWKANETSYGRGNTIERIFIPPRNGEEQRSVATALERHLAAGMTVRAFGAKWTGDDVLFKWQLPEGFGMTLLGARTGDDAPALTRVLIHWGYIGDKVPHHGVILTHPEWTAYFWGLFEQMAIKTQESAARTLPEFLEQHRNYTMQKASV